jgi:hypothetical protein
MKTVVAVAAAILLHGSAQSVPRMSGEERAAIEVVKCDHGCLGMLRHVVEMERLGGSTGWSEKWGPRLGDRVAAGLLRIGSEHPADATTIRVYLRVMRTAFSDPCYIDDSQSIRPRGTLAFLRWLSAHYPDLQSDINGVIDDLDAASRFDFHTCPPELQEISPWQKLP